jgi:dihydrodipicolinate synthase/N-acetylneuraminate lyase
MRAESATPSVIVALLTPFDEHGRVADGALRSHVEFLVDAGVGGLMPCGTTGEGPLLSDEEVLQVTATVVDAAKGRVPVVAHVGRISTAATLEVARKAVLVGAPAVSAAVPWYYALSDDQIVRHFAALISPLEVPVYAYAIPSRSGNDLSTTAAAALADSGLHGIKDSTKSLPRHLEFLATGLDVLMGSDGMVSESWRAGGSGCVSTIANIHPDWLLGLSRDFGGNGSSPFEGKILQLRSELAAGPEPTLVRLKREMRSIVPDYPTCVRAPLG